MTEYEWTACNDPVPMLDLLRWQATDRKLRLFAVACCRHIVVFAEILATPKLEIGSGIRPVQAAKTSLERPYCCTLVTLDP